MIIHGKTALITGGAARVGKAITLGLAQAGANVVIHFNRNAEQAAQTAKEAAAFGVSALPVQADIADWEQVQRMYREIHSKLGQIDILVNNASGYKETPIPTESVQEWLNITGVLINGPFFVSNLAAVDMLAKKEGAIVNIVDLSAWEAWPNLTAHVVGKAALLALTRQLALDLAPYVRVNAIAPGPVLPPSHYSAERIQRAADRTLLNRWGVPEDISKTVNFLIESAYINADVITVDGGERHGRRKPKTN